MKHFLLLFSCLFYGIHAFGQSYPFQQQRLSDDKRIDLLLDMLTIDEKMSLLTTNLGVPRLGIPSLGTYEGLHGLALGGPAMNNGRKTMSRHSPSCCSRTTASCSPSDGRRSRPLR